MKRLLPIFLIALFVSCGGEEVIQTDTLGDTSQDSDFIDTSPSQDIDEPGGRRCPDDATSMKRPRRRHHRRPWRWRSSSDHTLTFGITERSFVRLMVLDC